MSSGFRRDDEFNPGPVPSAFPASAGSVTRRAWPRLRRARGRRRIGRFRLHRGRLLRRLGSGLGGQRLHFAFPRRRGLRQRHRRRRAAGEMRDRSRWPRPAPDLARRRRTGRAVGYRQVLTGIGAHPGGRHEAENPPVAGIDHQPPAVTAVVDYRDTVDEAVQPGRAERREPAVAHHRVDLLRRQQGRSVAVARRQRRLRRHRRIRPIEVGDVGWPADLVRRQDLRVSGRGGKDQPGQHDPSREQLHRSLLAIVHASELFAPSPKP